MICMICADSSRDRSMRAADGAWPWFLTELRHLELLHFAGNATRSPVFVRGTQFAN